MSQININKVQNIDTLDRTGLMGQLYSDVAPHGNVPTKLGRDGDFQILAYANSLSR